MKDNDEHSATCPRLGSIHLPITFAPSLFFGLLCIVGIFWSPLALSVEAKPAALTHTELPDLGNSASGDRLLLREIDNRHVYDTRPDAGQMPTVAQTEASSAAERPLSVWELVRDSQRLSIPKHPEITRYRQQYAQEAIWVTRIFQRASPYIGFIVDELDKRYLPIELSLLPAIESGYQPDVNSPQRALGIWQIVPATATDIGLSSTTWFDGRSDIVESTLAAADYLSVLNAEFHGDWPLTLAAYNAGLGRVRSAIKRNRDAGKPADFWSLDLPNETREYVPKFLALVALLRYDRPANFQIPVVSQGSAFTTLEAPSRVSMDKLAALTGLPEQQLRNLNAGLIRGITPPEGPHTLYIPTEQAAPLMERMSSVSAIELFNAPEFHTVVAGDNLSTLALRYNVSKKRLRQLNSLESDVIKTGFRLRIFNSQSNDGRIDYVVTIGDTLSHIAQKYSVPVNNIRDERGQILTNDVIHPGERLSLLLGE